MKLKLNILNVSENIKSLTVGLLIVIITFPENDWSYLPGIDSPLS